MTGPNTFRVPSIHAPRVPSNSDGCPSHFESRVTTEVTQKENEMAMRLTASVLLLCRLCARPQVRAPAPARARRRRWPPLTAEAGRGGGVVLGYGSSVSTRERMSLTRGNLVTNSGACVAVRRTLVVMVEVSWTVLTFSPRNSRSAQRIIQIFEAGLLAAMCRTKLDLVSVRTTFHGLRYAWFDPGVFAGGCGSLQSDWTPR